MSTGPWTVPLSPTTPPVGGHEPALTVIGQIPHMVWLSNGTLYHSYRSGSSWTSPLPVAIGGEPSLVSTPDGSLHCLFSNRFASNYEIYHATWRGGRWSLPRNVSQTSGASTQPALAVGPNGTLHAAWSDTTPDYPVIYHAVFDGSFWSAMPIPNSHGQHPVLALASNGDLYAAWQDRWNDKDSYEILSIQRLQDQWHLPENVSDSPTVDSMEPFMACDASNVPQITWLEQAGDVYQVSFCQRVHSGWTGPETLSTPGANCLAPCIACNGQGITEVAWVEGTALRHRSHIGEVPSNWGATETVVNDLPGVASLAMAVDNLGSVHLLWTAFDSGNWQMYYSQREPVLNHKVYIPVLEQSGDKGLSPTLGSH